MPLSLKPFSFPNLLPGLRLRKKTFQAHGARYFLVMAELKFTVVPGPDVFYKQAGDAKPVFIFITQIEATFDMESIGCSSSQFDTGGTRILTFKKILQAAADVPAPHRPSAARYPDGKVLAIAFLIKEMGNALHMLLLLFHACLLKDDQHYLPEVALSPYPLPEAGLWEKFPQLFIGRDLHIIMQPLPVGFSTGPVLQRKFADP